MKLVMQPASGAVVSRDTPVTQAFTVENTMHGEKPLSVRMKLTYAAPGAAAPALDMVDVKSFVGF